jgi:hypothetical protein
MGLGKMRRQMDDLQAKYDKTREMDGLSSTHQNALVEHNRENREAGFGSLNASPTPYIAPLVWADWAKSNKSTSREDFMKAAADQLLNITASQAIRVGLEFEGEADGHAIAVARSDKEFMFFEPNGGLLCFLGGGCDENFRKWFVEVALKADQSSYDRISKMNFSKYTVTKGRLLGPAVEEKVTLRDALARDRPHQGQKDEDTYTHSSDEVKQHNAKFTAEQWKEFWATSGQAPWNKGF